MPFYGSLNQRWCTDCGEPIHKLMAFWWSDYGRRCITGSLYHIPMKEGK
jgi:hypothetical protein